LIVGIIIQTILSISGIACHGSLLTSGAFSLFLIYLNWQSLTNNQEAQCNFWLSKNNTLVIESVIGSILLVLDLCYVSFNNSGENA
jgi:hypothetical protein